jgi:hypothetical protein
MVIRNTHTFTNFEGKTFNVKNYVNCTTANVAYVLFCKHCDKFIYVGETGDTLYNKRVCICMYRQADRDSAI